MRYYNSYYPEICPGFKEFFFVENSWISAKNDENLRKIETLLFSDVPAPPTAPSDGNRPIASGIVACKTCTLSALYFVHRDVPCALNYKVTTGCKLTKKTFILPLAPPCLPACLPSEVFLPSLIWSAWLWLS